MHIVVTGANGFVGRALMTRLRAGGVPGLEATTRLTAMDTGFTSTEAAPLETRVPGSIAEPGVVSAAFSQPVDVVFHMASIPGGAAERHYELSRDVNVGGTTLLLEACKAQVERGGRQPIFVFASTIGVFASPMPDVVDDTTPPHPGMTYGAQKLIGEILVADFTRRGWADGRSLRLPGVLARPAAEGGHLSAFISNMIRELGAGRPFACPVSAQATTWGSSLGNVLDNLLHAAAIDGQRLGPSRCVTLPTLRFSFGELSAAIAQVHQRTPCPEVRWEPDARLEALFGNFPPLNTRVADAAGFSHDGDLPTLVRRATEYD